MVPREVAGMKTCVAFALAAFLAPAASAQAPDGAYGTLDIGLEGGGWARVGRTSRNGTGRLSMTWYSERLFDDGSPLSLQPFLQKVSAFGAELSGGGFSTSDPGWPSSYTGDWFAAAASVDHYLDRTFAIAAAASVERSETSGPVAAAFNPTYVLPRISAGPGLRFGDTRFDVGYRYAPVIRDGEWDSRGWGRVYAGVDSVIARTLLLSLDASTLPSGARAAAGFNFYYTPRFQLGASFSFERGQIYFDEERVYTRLSPQADTSWWFTPRLRALASYRFLHTTSDAGTVAIDEHRFTAALAVRLR